MMPAEFRAAKRQMLLDAANADLARRQNLTLKRLEAKYGKPKTKQ